MSGSDSNDQGCVAIERWLSTYLVPHDLPSPGELTRRLDQVVTRRLAGACAQCLGTAIDPADPSVWLIRRLDIDFSVDVNLIAEDRLARGWGERFALRLSEVLGRPAGGDSVVRFPNRAAYLAQFAIDLAAGRAWGKWYYDEFESLRSLSTSRAIGEALLREADHAAAVVLRLALLHRLEEVLSVLTETDARRIYKACFQGAGAPTPQPNAQRWTGRVLELWNEAPLRPASRDENRFRDALRLFARAAARFPGAGKDNDLRAALSGLLELRPVLASIRSPVVLDRIICSLAKNDLQGAIEFAREAGAIDPGNGLNFFARMMDGDADWAVQAAAVVLSERFREMASPANAALGGEPILTLFGAIFLLGPSLLELHLPEVAAAAAQRCGEPLEAASVIRHLVAVKCLGRARAIETMNDPALRLFSGFDGPRFPSGLQRLGVGKSDLEQAQTLLAQVQAGNGRYEGRYLLAETASLPCSGAEAWILRDLVYNEWIYAAEMPDEVSEIGDALERGLDCACQATGNEPEALLLRGRFNALIGSSALTRRAGRLISLDPEDSVLSDELAGELGITPERLSRASRPAGHDLAYFSLANLSPELEEVEAGIDLMFSLVARATLKHFARHLMGFAASSPEYLYQNFLSGVSTVRCTPERIEVRLPQSPLSMVLRMSGMQEQTYILPWLEGREVCLLPPVE